MKKTSTIFLLLALFTCAISSNAQILKPYLQTPAPNSVWVTWKTPSDSESTVLWGTSALTLTQNTSGSVKVMSDNGYPSNYFYHSVQLTGLTPNTPYFYRIKTGNDTSVTYQFRTLPEYGQGMSDGHQRFIIIGDNQLKSARWDTLVVAAKRKAEELYGTPISDKINMVVNVGDQVDVGTLDHYENVHLDKARYLSSVLPFNTLVGNHETYGTLNMSAYYDHFFYSQYTYKGISSGTENYYAFQAGRVLFLMLSSEHTGNAQKQWAYSVIDSANSDTSVDWIITECHRPYTAEQYVGDISTWLVSQVVPKLEESPKASLIIGAHHHLYARGQLKNKPVYHIISGGSAWDQYWGMSTEQDFDDVQKTIPNWGYQIIDFDLAAKSMSVSCYSTGSIYKYKNNQLIDSFYRVYGKAAPAQPSSASGTLGTVALPVTLISSAYSSPASEPYNSTQFQVSKVKDFSITSIDKLRDYENWYGSAGSPDSTTNVNAGVDIFRLTIPANSISNGKYYFRIRHRDRNLEWSPWSVADSFTVTGSSVPNTPTITTPNKTYALNTPVSISYFNGPGFAKDWIGIYKKGQTPGQTGSTVWSYVSGPSGSMNLTVPTSAGQGEYFIAFFQNDLYTEVAPRVNIFVGNKPSLSTDSAAYVQGSPVVVNYATAPGLTNDWIGIYKVGMTPGSAQPSVQWQYTSGAAGSRTFNGLSKGYYYVTYMVNGGYFEPSDRVYFSVGDRIASISTDKPQYIKGDSIKVTFADGPGIAKDWIGIYDSIADPNIDTLTKYTYVGGKPSGTAAFAGSNLPDNAGNYFVVFFTNDSYNEISNRVYFKIINNPVPVSLFDFDAVKRGSVNEIYWVTASEKNTSRFIIERSADGINFVQIGTVAAYGNSSVMQKYLFNDGQPLKGQNYYRLKMLDFDNSSEYSNVVVVSENDIQNKALDEITIYPNPVVDRATIRSDYPIEYVEIYDMKGNLLTRLDDVRTNEFLFLGSEFEPGTYLLKVQGRKLITIKMAITR
jgi:acid phosphatase type 7